MPGWNKSKYPDGTRNVYRTLTIIREVYKLQGNQCSLSHIARSLDIPIPTVKRILSVLTIEGFVNFDSVSKTYHIGYDLYKMIKNSLPLMIKERYHTAIQRIAGITEDTTYLVIRKGLDTLCIDIATGSRSIEIPYGVGTLTPLGLIASGIVLLAGLDNKKINDIVEKNSDHFGRFNTEPGEVWNSINTVRESGYIRCESIVVEGLMNVAVPIPDENGDVICSIVVSSTEPRLPPERCKEIAHLILEQVNGNDIHLG